MTRELALSAIISLAAAVAACSGEASQTHPQDGRSGGVQPPAVPVSVAPVVQKAMPIDLSVIGSAQAYSTVAVHAQVTGELTSVNFAQGDDVRKGQTLFTLDRRPLEAALAQSEANLQRDLAQAANAKSQAARYQDLSTRGIATREQLDQITTNAAALEGTVAADRAAVENANVQLQYATIAAPIAGRTGVLMVQAGNLVRAADTTPLVVINQVSPIYVAFAIPEAQLPAFKRYLAQGSIRVEASPPNESGAASAGRVTFVDNAVDQTTGTIKVIATFSNEDRRLWPGQFVNVAVTLASEPSAIVVPSSAIQNGPQGQYVFVVKPDQTVELRRTTTAWSRGRETVIKDGLKPGETVVTDGQIRLVPGSRISVSTGAQEKAGQ
jgi:multidrug efflux system membrane fusion protein